MTAVSLGVLLATFMGGLCIGSLLLPRTKFIAMHPLRLYGFIEIGIAPQDLGPFGITANRKLYCSWRDRHRTDHGDGDSGQCSEQS